MKSLDNTMDLHSTIYDTDNIILIFCNSDLICNLIKEWWMGIIDLQIITDFHKNQFYSCNCKKFNELFLLQYS